MQVSNANHVKIYSVTSAARSAIPDWLARRNAKSLKKDQEYRRRIELIQDFEFPEASLRIKPTRDGQHIIATGVYQPQMRVFDLAQKSLKFDRHQDCENVQFEILSDDWTKTVMLQADRTIELHTQFGLHYKTRVPKFGRDLAYHYPSCDLMIGGASNEVWRLNLDQGRFLASLQTECTAVNVVEVNPAHQLFGFGGEDGRVEFWHPRERRRIGALDIGAAVVKSLGSASLDAFPQITALKFADDGLTYAVGTATGQVLTFDLRSASPMVIKDHQYGFPIKSLHMHATTGNVVSADTKIIKVWDQNTGKAFTSIEPPNDINDVCVWDNSGLIMVANEGVQIQTFYIPQLGPAPKWCSYLDNLTEEMEEKPTDTMYDDYKFVTRKELSNLGLDHLVGTNVLKAYMHGFFLDLRLYEKAKAIANPFEYDEYKKRMVQERIDKQRASRISAVKKLPKINRNMAVKLMAEDQNSDDDDDDDGGGGGDNNNGSKRKKRKKEVLGDRSEASTENPLGDARFADLFRDEDFQVDETSHEWKLHHPSESRMAIARQAFAKVRDDDDEDDVDEDEDQADRSDEEGESDDDADYNSDDSEDDKIRFTRFTKPKPSSTNARGSGSSSSKTTTPSFYELKNGHTATSLAAAAAGSSSGGRGRNNNNTRQDATTNPAKRSFADRIAAGGAGDPRIKTKSAESATRSGNFSITFQPGVRDGGGDNHEVSFLQMGTNTTRAGPTPPPPSPRRAGVEGEEAAAAQGGQLMSAVMRAAGMMGRRYLVVDEAAAGVAGDREAAGEEGHAAVAAVAEDGDAGIKANTKEK
ncbi:Nucleolar protein 10 [Geranomyces michiganensis]|nr:Nucleolar protein 10 [Geranomyces michiganensis]